MMYSHIRKTIPIYEKINPIKLMHLSKTFGRICKISFTCQIFTKTSCNNWIFKYKANNTLYITISFYDKCTEPYPYIVIDDFVFPENLRKQKLDEKILRIIINHVQYLDFEMLIFNINQKFHIGLCKKNGFKQIGIHKMIVSLKPKFIQNIKPI
ncbi:hypothetical protein FQB35_05860 [Crassaminicella thermophila]|uniref:N-acetyltransferase domain-containing protein n=1 Tax=Crassaminicella thermophila TaxID=2599308 RepID=A0A5C0SBJ4_CRATE|nr:hypothetical protein [Crassaminicella thermophila]QEK11933.1 hypothetical protein FQB35_05860 [Crassaminicella thermophila]